MRAAAAEYGWNLDFGNIALMWRGGCIIRSVFLGKIKEAFDRQPDLKNLLLDPYFKEQVEGAQESWRRVVSRAVRWGVPVPATSSALAFYDGYRQAWLPAQPPAVPSGTTSAPTPTSAWTGPAASSSTLAGRNPRRLKFQAEEHHWHNMLKCL